MPAAGWLLLAVLILPVASAQAPTTRVDLVVRPTGTWDADGYVDAGRERVEWGADSTVTFSNTAACPDPVPIRFKLDDPEGRFTSRSIQPTATTVDVPQGGGSKAVQATVTGELDAQTRGGEPFDVSIKVEVDACSGIGTSPATAATTQHTLTPLLRPLIDVAHDNRSDEGRFRFEVNNVGNGRLAVSATVSPIGASPAQPVDPVSGLSVDWGEYASFNLAFPEKRPGLYRVTVLAVFDGPEPEKQPKGTYEAEVEIPAPIVVTETRGSSPGAGTLIVLVAGVLGVWTRRRG